MADRKRGELSELEKVQIAFRYERKSMLQRRAFSRLSALEEIGEEDASDCEDDDISVDEDVMRAAVPTYLAMNPLSTRHCSGSPTFRRGSNCDFHSTGSPLQCYRANALSSSELVLNM